MEGGGGGNFCNIFLSYRAPDELDRVLKLRISANYMDNSNPGDRELPLTLSEKFSFFLFCILLLIYFNFMYNTAKADSITLGDFLNTVPCRSENNCLKKIHLHITNCMYLLVLLLCRLQKLCKLVRVKNCITLISKCLIFRPIH